MTVKSLINAPKRPKLVLQITNQSNHTDLVNLRVLCLSCLGIFQQMLKEDKNLSQWHSQVWRPFFFLMEWTCNKITKILIEMYWQQHGQLRLKETRITGIKKGPFGLSHLYRGKVGWENSSSANTDFLCFMRKDESEGETRSHRDLFPDFEFQF